MLESFRTRVGVYTRVDQRFRQLVEEGRRHRVRTLEREGSTRLARMMLLNRLAEDEADRLLLVRLVVQGTHGVIRQVQGTCRFEAMVFSDDIEQPRSSVKVAVVLVLVVHDVWLRLVVRVANLGHQDATRRDGESNLLIVQDTSLTFANHHPNASIGLRRRSRHGS